jgi:hypothetical protein
MLAVRFLKSRSEPQIQSTSSLNAASYGHSPYTTPSMARSTGSTMTPGAASTPSSGYTAAAQDALNRATPSPATSPARSGSPSGIGSASGSGMIPGTPAVQRPGTGSLNSQADQPTPSPSITPRSSGPTAGSESAAPAREPGTRTSDGSSTSGRSGAGSRNQP